MKLIASLGDWAKADTLMQKILSQKFGNLLATKFAEFQESKAEMKECISKHCGNAMVLKSPKRAKPLTNLLEQIDRFRIISLEDEAENTSVHHIEVADAAMMLENNMEESGNAVVVVVNERDADPYAFNEQNQQTNDVPIQVNASAVPKGRAKPNKYVSKTPVQPSTSRPKRIAQVPRPSLRQQKIKQIKDKTEQAVKQREEYLREKAERIKREREEARQRVEQNNRIKEAEQKERELQREREEKRLREYRLEQERTANSPFRGQMAFAPKMTPKHPNVAVPQLKSTPRQLMVPPKRSKTLEFRQESPGALEKANKKEETQRKLEEEIREQQRREEELREQRQMERERQEQEKRENERREQQLREQRRIEEEREQARHEQQRLEKERLEKEKREKELREKEQRENELRDKEKAKKFKNVSVYDMTPDKVYLPSSKDNYNVDDLSSNDETDNEDKPRKEVPKWAQKRELTVKVAALRRLVPEENRARYFGRMKQPTVEDFFKNQLKQYPLRSSSAIWTSPMSDPTPGEGRYHAFQKAASK